MTTTRPQYPLLLLERRLPALSLDTFAAQAGLHPDLVRRFVALGLLNASRDPTGGLWFAPDQLAVAASIRRLHSSLPLNYAAIGLVLDLLGRIAELEDRMRRTTSWT